MRRRGLAVGLALALGALEAAPAAGDVPAADEAAAKGRFAAGERAFKKGDFLAAAEAFDEANRLAPHPAALWNAARAWHKAGELPRAANLYRRYLRVAPADGADRGAATAALAELSQKLGRVDVVAPDGAKVTIDKLALEGSALVVNPGSHAVEAELGERRERRVVEVAAGAVVSLTVLQTEPPAASAREPAPPPSAPPPPAPAPPPAPVASASAPPSAAAPPPDRRPLPPWSVAVGGTVTAALAGVTIGLGVDVLSKREAYDAAPSLALFDAGKDAQLQANVLLGVTLGAAAVTLALAVFATDWGGATRPKVTLQLPRYAPR